MTRDVLLAGNWKMHGSRADARAWAEAANTAAKASRHAVGLFVPAPYLQEVLAAAPECLVGAQACHWEAKGAYTGAVSAAMLASCGVPAVLCGHSERRHVFGESDEDVAGATEQAWAHGLVPVLCVGETEAERDEGQTQAVIVRQLEAVLARMPTAEAPLILAYEPVWAIGTGRAASSEEAAQAHAWLRAAVADRLPDRAATLQILYGGSVKPANIAGFLSEEDIDGALIGGASLDPKVFGQILATP